MLDQNQSCQNQSSVTCNTWASCPGQSSVYSLCEGETCYRNSSSSCASTLDCVHIQNLDTCQCMYLGSDQKTIPFIPLGVIVLAFICCITCPSVLCKWCCAKFKQRREQRQVQPEQYEQNLISQTIPNIQDIQDMHGSSIFVDESLISEQEKDSVDEQ